MVQLVLQAVAQSHLADQAVEPKWLHHADQVVAQHQAADQAVALKPHHAIHAELHPAIADVVSKLASVVCSRRFSSAKAAAIQLRVVIRVQHLRVAAHADPLQAVAALVVVEQLSLLQHPHQCMHQHQWLTHMLT